jgi:hypothetical protein
MSCYSGSCRTTVSKKVPKRLDRTTATLVSARLTSLSVHILFTSRLGPSVRAGAYRHHATRSGWGLM